jgi:hypothetical protein
MLRHPTVKSFRPNGGTAVRRRHLRLTSHRVFRMLPFERAGIRRILPGDWPFPTFRAGSWAVCPGAIRGLAGG